MLEKTAEAVIYPASDRFVNFGGNIAYAGSVADLCNKGA